MSPFFFWLYSVACRILVPQPGIEPMACRVLPLDHQGIPSVSPLFFLQFPREILKFPNSDQMTTLSLNSFGQDRWIETWELSHPWWADLRNLGELVAIPSIPVKLGLVTIVENLSVSVCCVCTHVWIVKQDRQASVTDIMCHLAKLLVALKLTQF